MTWFQLVRNDETEPRPAAKLAGKVLPNSAFFLNPALPPIPHTEPETVRPEPSWLDQVR